MKDRKQKQTDDQIEAEVLAKLRDASAWEVLPAVPPSSSQRPDWARAGFHAAEERTFEASRAATPSQRLAWLEEALAYKVGALKLDPPERREPSSEQRPDVETVNRLRDET